MEDLFFSLLTLVLQWFRPRYNAHLQLLQAQIRILRSRIDVSRIVPTPKEKAELLRLGALVDHNVAEVMHVVQPETYRKWVRQSKRGEAFKPSGRPRIPKATVNLVLRMAQENVRWGYRRIVGEFKKLVLTTVVIRLLSYGFSVRMGLRSVVYHKVRGPVTLTRMFSSIGKPDRKWPNDGESQTICLHKLRS